MAFWAAFEKQTKKVVGTNTNEEGKIKLEYWQLDNGVWESQAAKTFKSGQGSSNWRRRPMISSFASGSGDAVVSIAFGKFDSDPGSTNTTGNVVYEQWKYDNGSLIPVPGTMVKWPNSSDYWDDRPVPLHGRDTPYIRRCYATRDYIHTTSDLEQLVSFDDVTNPVALEILDESIYVGLRRPGAAYHLEPSALNPDYFAVCWEKTTTPGSSKRVWIRVDWY